MAIYLHYLDRELRASVNCSLSDAVLLDVTATAAVMTDHLLYCSLSFLYETCLAIPYLKKFFLDLLSHDHLQALSSHPTLGEFMESRRVIYAHDATRYPMYFEEDKAIESVLQLNPHYKLASATGSLIQGLTNTFVIGSSESPVRPPALRVQLHDVFSRGLEQIGAKAVTFSAFEKFADTRDAILAGNVRRSISEHYTGHYLSLMGGVLLSGIPGLGYYDLLARFFPEYDYPLLNFLRRKIFSDNAKFGQGHRVGDGLIDSRGSPDHRAFTKRVGVVLSSLGFMEQIQSAVYFQQARARMSSLLGRTSEERVVRKVGPAKNYRDALDLLEAWVTETARVSPDFRDAEKFVQSVNKERRMKVLLCTATDVEDEILAEIVPELGLSINPVNYQRGTYVRLGVVEQCQIYWVRSRMGSTGPNASELTTQDAIDDVRPDYVISYGICFGFKEGKHSIGDVVVSEWLRLYEKQKVEERGKIIPRGERLAASGLLLQRAAIARLTFKDSAVHIGGMVSGDKVVDDPALKKRLLQIEPEAFAGDMEGGGVVSAADRRKIHWLVVKSICDWGEKKNTSGRDKDSDQRLAARNAIRFVVKLLGGVSVVPVQQ